MKGVSQMLPELFPENPNSSSEHLTAVDWSQARCRSTLDGVPVAELFFSEEPADIARAKSLCSECELQSVCLSGARERREPCGVWGGELFANGKVLAFKRKRGRPPKNAPLECSA